MTKKSRKTLVALVLPLVALLPTGRAEGQTLAGGAGAGPLIAEIVPYDGSPGYRVLPPDPFSPQLFYLETISMAGPFAGMEPGPVACTQTLNIGLIMATIVGDEAVDLGNAEGVYPSPAIQGWCPGFVDQADCWLQGEYLRVGTVFVAALPGGCTMNAVATSALVTVTGILVPQITPTINPNPGITIPNWQQSELLGAYSMAMF